MDLISRINRVERAYRADQVIVAGYDRTDETRQHVRFFSDKNAFEQQFPQQKAEFNGRIVVHTFGTREYECLTDIVTKAPEHRKGHWLIVGQIDGKKKGKFYATQEEMMTARKTVFAESPALLVHKIGTSDYTVIFQKKDRTA